MIVLEIYTLIEVFDLYTQSLPNLSSGVMHNHDIVLWEKKKTSPNLDMLAEIYDLQTRQVTCGYICTWHTLSSSWNHLPK